MSFLSLFTDVRALVVFLAIISVLVAAHEYGHYLFARLFGMGVEDFSIGMGKAVKVWKRKTYTIPVPLDYVHTPALVSEGASFEGGDRPIESVLLETPSGKVLQETTDFTVRMLPIGGFVRIKGMVPQDDGSEVRIQGGFYSKPPWQRLIVLLAGPAASVLSGLIVLTVLFLMQGVRRNINEPVLGAVFPDSIAYSASLRAGDRILSVNGKTITTFYDLVKDVNDNAGHSLELRYDRNGKQGMASVIPASTEGQTYGPDLEIGTEITTHGVIGIQPKNHLVPVGLGGAILESVRFPIESVQSMFEMVKKPSTVKQEAGGVVTMVRVTSDAAQEGLTSTIALAALLSISVGIFNLLPIPPLDGGQMAVAFAELFRGGRRLSIQVQQMVNSAGMLLILVLFVLVLFIDVQRVAGGNPNPAASHATASPKK